MSDDRLRDGISSAQGARELLQHEMLKEAFDSLQTDYMNLWKHTKPSEVEGREKIFIAWHVVGKVQEHLQRILENGKLAQIELDEMIAKQQRKKIFNFR